MRFMTTKGNVSTARRLSLFVILVAVTFSAHAGDLYSPALPATGAQFLECRIVNITNSPQEVTSQAFDSTGTPSTGLVTQTLAPGEAGGFSISAVSASVYCKFTVKGSTNGFRASIDVLDATTVPPSIVVALPAH